MSGGNVTAPPAANIAALFMVLPFILEAFISALASFTEKSARTKALKITACAVICMLMIGAVLNSLAVKNQLTREIAKKEIAIANAQSEYISLESQLNSLVSISMIDKYAVEELGMTKVRSNQIQYMDVSEFKAEREAALAEAEAAEQAAENTEETAEQEVSADDGGEVINN